MIRSLLAAAALLASCVAGAVAQGPPPGTLTSLPIVCYPAGAAQKSSDLGRPIWRGIIRDGSTAYEMLDTPNGWLLMLRTREQFCIVASGDQHAVPAGQAEQPPSQ